MAMDFILEGAAAVSFSLFWSSTTIAVASIAISCAAGVLIGVASPSVLLGVILVIYGGNQVASITILPRLLGLELANENLFIIGVSISFTVVFLLLAILIFERQEF